MPVCELLVASVGKSDTALSDRVSGARRAGAVCRLSAQLDWEQRLAELRRRYDAAETAQIGVPNAVCDDSTVSQPHGYMEGSRPPAPDVAVHVAATHAEVAASSLVFAGRSSAT